MHTRGSRSLALASVAALWKGAVMTTPQDPPVRNKQKRRRTKKLAAWRLAKAAAGPSAAAAAPAAPAATKAAKAAKKTEAKK